MYLFVIVIGINIFLSACDKKKEDEIHLINNKPGKWTISGLVKSITVKKEWSLGVAEGDITQEFYRPKDFAVDIDGNVYVLDSGNFKVRIFDSSGNFKNQFGQKGMGPGEFSGMVHRIKFMDSNTVFVVDSDLRRITLFNKDGHYLNSYNLYTLVSDALPLNNNLFLISNFILDYNHKPIHIFNIKKGEKILSFGEIQEPGDDLISKVKGTPDQWFFSYFPMINIAIDKHNNIYYLQKNPYLIQKYNFERMKLFDFTRTTSYSTMSNATFEEIDENVFQWSLAKHSAVTGGIQVFDDSLIVTSVFSPDLSENSVDIFNLQGELLISIDIPSQFDGPKTGVVSAKMGHDRCFYILYESQESYPKLDKFLITLK